MTPMPPACLLRRRAPCCARCTQMRRGRDSARVASPDAKATARALFGSGLQPAAMCGIRNYDMRIPRSKHRLRCAARQCVRVDTPLAPHAKDELRASLKARKARAKKLLVYNGIRTVENRH